MNNTTHTPGPSKEVLLYTVRSSQYQDYVSLYLGESEIFQAKTTKQQFRFAEQELRICANAANLAPELMEALEAVLQHGKNSIGVETVWYNKVLSIINKAKGI